MSEETRMPAQTLELLRFSTTAVTTEPDVWTARISRTDVSSGGQSTTTSSIVSVGSISHLIGESGGVASTNGLSKQSSKSSTSGR